MNKSRLTFFFWSYTTNIFITYATYVYMAMWRSWLRRQSGYPEVVGSNPAGGKSWKLDELSQDRVLRDFLSLAIYFTPPRWLNWVPGIRWACIVDDSTLSVYNPQLLGLYTPEWRLRKSIYVEQNRPAGVIMCEALSIKALYKNSHYYYYTSMHKWKYSALLKQLLFSHFYLSVYFNLSA